MAQINLKNIKRIDKNRNLIHDKVHTTYTIFEADGNKYIQLDTAKSAELFEILTGGKLSELK